MRRYAGPGPALPAVVAVLVLLLPGCGGGTGSADASPSASTAPVATVPALLGPVGLAQAADGIVWAAFAGTDAIAPLDGEGQPGTPIEVGDTPLRITALDGSMWVTTIMDGLLHQVLPTSATVVRSIDLGGQPEGLTTFAGHLFVVLQAAAELVEVDPADGSVVQRYRVGGEPRLVAAGDDALYVGDFARGRVVRITPGSGGTPVRSAAVCSGVQDLEVLDGRVWAACMTDGTVVALDPRTLAVLDTVRVEGDPDGLAPGPGADLLVSLQDGPSLAVLDTATGSVDRVFTGTTGRLDDRANADVLERDGAAYLSDYAGNRVQVVPFDR
ncbi:MAG: hypothetical protein ABI807_04415 [Sporichthyaceae bacterium]